MKSIFQLLSLSSFLFCLTLLSSFATHAKNNQFGLPAKDLPQEYQQKGDLFTIRLVPADKETKLYIVGNEIASLKVEQLDVVGKIKIGKNEKVLRFQRKADHFSATAPIQGDVQLNVKMLDQPKEETFNLRMKKN